MVFELDPDKPDVPALARILSLFGVLSLMGSAIAMLLAFSRYTWVNEIWAMVGAVGGLLLALLFIGQAKTLELLAVVSARLKSRYAIENLTRTMATAAAAPPEKKAAPVLTTAPKDRVIHVPDEQAREQGFKVR
jgi:hypothetical protein